ncbi:MAG: histidine phosphatase family protein [Rickettsiella sp.]|nr:histidine phosphatase family protein [Rickettsiella sp.]
MRIIFSRHGNTFSPGETPIWVGAREDLPLVDSGIQQAKNLAYVIQQTGLTIKAVYCGPLKRTYDYANTILNELHSPLKPIIDLRLNEIDYGDWSGLSNEEIRKKGDHVELYAWENFCKWPKAANWLGSPHHMLDDIKSFAEDIVKKHIPEDTILVTTSNGRLRYFLQLVPNAFEQYIKDKSFKVATGNICLLVYDKDWHIKFWNKKPESLL